MSTDPREFERPIDGSYNTPTPEAIEAAARAEYNALLPHNACACHFSWETLADWSREKRIKAMSAALSAAYPLMEAQAKGEAWDEGVATALNHAILNEDGITLRLEHLDGRPWANPYRAATIENEATP